MKHLFKNKLNLPQEITMKFNTKDTNVFVCSDPHYSHKNLIKKLSKWKSGAHRNFDSVQHHNDTLVANINKTVGKNDVLFMLGDIAFGGFDNIKIFMDRIICDEVHLIYGNHDEDIIANKNNVRNCFTTCSYYREIQVDDDMFSLFHYPINEWNGIHKGWYHCWAHQHNTPDLRFKYNNRSMDVGFDGHPEFRPYNIKEIVTLLKDKPILTHH